MTGDHELFLRTVEDVHARWRRARARASAADPRWWEIADDCEATLRSARAVGVEGDGRAMHRESVREGQSG